MTDYSELEKSRRIRPGRFSSKQISDCLALSRRDLKIAETILKENQDWAFNIAYNAMLQATKALMYSKGFRPPVASPKKVLERRFVASPKKVPKS